MANKKWAIELKNQKQNRNEKPYKQTSMTTAPPQPNLPPSAQAAVRCLWAAAYDERSAAEPAEHNPPEAPRGIAWSLEVRKWQRRGLKSGVNLVFFGGFWSCFWWILAK